MDDEPVMSDADGTTSAPGLALGGASRAARGYRVLARKYRPQTFDDLIGQDAMVRTISNAFEAAPHSAGLDPHRRARRRQDHDRPHPRPRAQLRAAGRLGAGPTVKMPALGVHCQAIMESRHLDVIEMDAASHNGVDDVRQINDAIRYAPVSARYKVYILDEVHMLSGAAFNALLKTLEEPPPHAKFIFATTEIRKVPVTVLSRCQRFDLRRVDAGMLVEHLASIAAKEGDRGRAGGAGVDRARRRGLGARLAVAARPGDRACAPGRCAPSTCGRCSGLADRARIIDLFEALMRGDVAAALAELRAQYDTGADPAVVLGDLAEFTHFVTRVKIVPAVADDPALIEVERTRGRGFAEKLSMRVLSRTWQMLLKGIAEVQEAGRPVAAAEMVLVRIAYAADLPTPDEVVRSLSEGNGSTPEPGHR